MAVITFNTFRGTGPSYFNDTCVPVSTMSAGVSWPRRPGCLAYKNHQNWSQKFFIFLSCRLELCFTTP